MKLEFDPQILFYIFFATIVGFMLLRSTQYGGFKAAMFGAPIESTVAEVSGNRSKFMKQFVKVHKLGGKDPEKTIGLELVSKSVASYQMTPVSLSTSEAKNLIKLLEAAVSGK